GRYWRRRARAGLRGRSRGGRRRLFARELVVQVAEAPLDHLVIRSVRRAALILLEGADGFGLVAFSLVGGGDDGQHAVDAAVDRGRVVEVADRFLVIRLSEILLSTQEYGVRPADVGLAHAPRV